MHKNLQNAQKETPSRKRPTINLCLIMPLYPLNIPHNHEPTLLRQLQKLTRVRQHAPLGHTPPPPAALLLGPWAPPPCQSGDTPPLIPQQQLGRVHHIY